ncbi:hypothetical protein FSARC_5059 [Fusarium sarcochroum]|uniref:Uncharacterized protein n=1 Tax=Fusarium sarcochroum TaxID=1208366 RepID=A0A8H4U078_9HYPO|nr:hypothetical protein FSARC_5059 [Fusarium sarcochroum]
MDMAISITPALRMTPARNGSSNNSSLNLEHHASRACVATRGRRRPRRIYRPAKNSLYDILWRYSGTSLFVRPICWIDLHALLLGVTWNKLPPCDIRTPPSSGDPNLTKTTKTLSNALTHILLSDSTGHGRRNAVETVLGTLWTAAFSKPQSSVKLHLYFGGRVYHHAVRAQAMWNSSSSPETRSSYSPFNSVLTQPTNSSNIVTQPYSTCNTANSPMICYVDKTQLDIDRADRFRVTRRTNGVVNGPVYRLLQRRARMVVPPNPDRDAYFVGVLLGMAQKHFYPTPPDTGRRESWISSPEKDTLEFIIYTGYVTKEFLTKFHDPFKAPLDDDDAAVSGLKIDYTKVPIWPIPDLQARLGKALGQDVVGTSDPEDKETRQGMPDKLGDGKRTREVPSEMIKMYPREESEEEPAITSKKRCRNIGRKMADIDDQELPREITGTLNAGCP